MAYMNQDKKAKIALALKLVVPSSWKYSLAVEHHSTIIMTIKSAPVDLLSVIKNRYPSFDGGSRYLRNILTMPFESGTLKVLQDISDTLNLDNHDNSDLQSDYFDVGHYVTFNIGQWNKPFVVK